MDVRLFLAVLWRNKWLTSGGVVLAVVLAALAYGTPGLSHGRPVLRPRAGEVWQSQSELLITQQSFPYGRAAQQYVPGSSKSGTPATPVGDVGYMASLAPIYATLANGNTIQTQLHTATRAGGSVEAVAVSESNSGSSLPFVQFTATAPSSADAHALAFAAATTLQKYVAQSQAAAAITPTQQVQLRIVKDGTQVALVKKRKLTVSVLVFLAVLAAVIALVFIFANAKQRSAARTDDLGAGARIDDGIVPAAVTNGAGTSASVAGIEMSNGDLAHSGELADTPAAASKPPA